MTPFNPDVWSEWLLHRRHADDPAFDRIIRSMVEGYADRVLDGARLKEGMTLLDVGAGEGLVAFRAIQRIGTSLKVVLTDVSNTMLTYAESAAHALHVNSQCRFLHCSAERLDGLADSSVDVVTTRAAIAYVTDKSAALREFYRVLKPDGRLSMAEPLMQDDAFHARALRNRVEDPSRPVDRFLTLVHRWKSAQFPDTEEAAAKSPIASYSERDLLIMTRDAGFGEIHLQLHIDMLPAVAVPWSVFIGTTPHPWAPSLKEILAERFTAEEAQFFEETMRPRIESGKSTATGRVVYLQATR